MAKSKQTFENFKEESARLLTPISELPQFKAMVNNVKSNLANGSFVYKSETLREVSFSGGNVTWTTNDIIGIALDLDSSTNTVK